MRAIEILEKLVSFRSVVGTPNHEIVGWIRHFLEGLGASITVLPGPEGDRANLFASIGPVDRPGYILSGHMDVVPAEEADWRSPPFDLTQEQERLYGRGAVDMKGFLAAALASFESLSNEALSSPIHLAFSYDEEAGCRGVPHMIAKLGELVSRPLGVIVGEPSGMRPVLAHKGKAAARATIYGKSGHSSRPDLGLNAIHALGGVLAVVVEAANQITAGPFDATFIPPYSTLQAGVVKGGQAVNIIPEFACLELEARAISTVRPDDLLAPVQAALSRLESLGFRTEWETLSSYPALSLNPSSELAATVAEVAGSTPLAAVSYGTEAGLYQAAGFDAIICGPGDIARAHRANEFIETSELIACQDMITALARKAV